MTRQYFSNSIIAKSSFSPSGWRDKVNLSFTPDPSSNYAIIWSGIVGITGSIDLLSQLYHKNNSNAVLTSSSVRLESTSDFITVGGLYVYQSNNSPNIERFGVRYGLNSLSTTVSMQDTHIIAIKLEDGQDKYISNSATLASSSIIPTKINDLNIPEASNNDYFVVSYVETNASSTTFAQPSYGQKVSGTSLFSNAYYVISTSDYLPIMHGKIVTFGSDKTVKQYGYRTGAFGTSTFRRARSVAIKLTNTANSLTTSYDSNNSSGQRAISSTSYSNVRQISSSVASQPYLTFSSVDIQGNGGTILSNTHFDTSNNSTTSYYSKNITGETTNRPAFYLAVSNLTQGTKTFSIRGKVDTGSADWQNASLSVLQLGDEPNIAYPSGVSATASIGSVTVPYTTPIGQIIFDTPSSNTSWVVPYGVNTISLVAIGGGGSGSTDLAASAQGGGGGGGGALAYSNNVSVTPGEVLYILVGAGGSAVTTADTNGNPGANSSVYYASNSIAIVNAVGGSGGIRGDGNFGAGGLASSSTGDVKQDGGDGGLAGTSESGAGGGAAGYSGAGGDGPDSDVPESGGTAGTGGAGGSGGSGDSDNPAGGGGGVGLFGEGSSGSGGTTGTLGTGGGGGSGGTPGGNATSTDAGAGGSYGGGGGAASDDGNENSGAGGSGAVRIIWGGDRLYPTNAANIIQNVSISASSFNLVSSLGTVIANTALDVSVNVTGVSDTGTVGTLSIVGNAQLSLSGVSATGYVESVFLRQRQRPSADNTVGNWLNESLLTTNLYQSIDEINVADTSDYIRNSNSISSFTNNVEIKLSDGFNVNTYSNHKLRYTIGRSDHILSVPVSLTVVLLQNTTVIASWAENNVSNTISTIERTLTPTQANSITNYSDLFVRFSANNKVV